jgi:hypothetical protein
LSLGDIIATNAWGLSTGLHIAITTTNILFTSADPKYWPKKSAICLPTSNGAALPVVSNHASGHPSESTKLIFKTNSANAATT